MKTNLILLFATSSICLVVGLFVVKAFLPSAVLPDGAAFESVDDLRSQLTKRDSRDVKPDASVSFRSIVGPHPSDSIIYQLLPNLDVRFQKVPVHTNSHGMRSKEVPIEKGKDVLRIALLGDSFAFGWGVEEDKIFARVIEDELNEKLAASGKRVEVLNFGVPGYSTFQEVAQFLETGIKFQPDLVLVYFVDNDFGLPFFIKRFDGTGSLTSGTNFHKLRSAATDKEVIARQQELKANVDPNRHLKLLADEMQKLNVPVFITINPRKSVAHDVKRLHIMRHHDNLTYLSIREEYIQIVKGKNLTREDLTLKHDPHPNALRHGIYGELLAKLLLPHMPNTKERL